MLQEGFSVLPDGVVKGEATFLARCACDGKLSVQQRCDALYDGEPLTGAAVVAGSPCGICSENMVDKQNRSTDRAVLRKLGL